MPSLDLKPDEKPRFFKPRPIPYAYKEGRDKAEEIAKGGHNRASDILGVGSLYCPGYISSRTDLLICGDYTDWPSVKPSS